MRQAEDPQRLPWDVPLEEEASLAGFWQKLTWRLFLLPDSTQAERQRLRRIEPDRALGEQVVQIGIDDP